MPIFSKRSSIAIEIGGDFIGAAQDVAAEAVMMLGRRSFDHSHDDTEARGGLSTQKML
ncbi:hypothetical protein [Bradyrhizobium forestalis]|uniref:hypothetical protein n=1 Tax=Bradyrhizobium forestalis TaxID=1419263 RepID=UPI0013047B70|nr:hypothetical protein [Bradyrhizobium forestalis]